MTTREQTLSELVMTYIDSLEHDDLGLTPEEFAESQKIRAMISIIVNDLIKSRETLTDNKLEAIERAVEAEPEITKGWLDQRFTKDAVEVVSGYVNRTMQLSRMKSDRLPSKITNGYLREAIHTYILGLPQASVALSRAALEQALKEGVGYQSTRTFVKGVRTNKLNEQLVGYNLPAWEKNWASCGRSTG